MPSARPYTMRGLSVDYHLMSNIEGLFVLGEANFSDHGANRLGASALMQGLADGYFVVPYTIGSYLATKKAGPLAADAAACRQTEQEVKQRISRILRVKGKRTATSIHHELGQLLWDRCGMARNAQGLKKALEGIPALREEFWHNVSVPGDGDDINQALEYAGRVAD